MTDPNTLIQALEAFARGTRRMFERVPLDQAAWKPHEKSMSLKSLVGHLVTLPKFTHLALTTEDFEYNQEAFPKFTPESTEDLLNTYDAYVNEVKETLAGMQPADLEVNWRFHFKGQTFVDAPRRQVFYDELNHQAHHRGQLSVYLRLLGVPLPGVYGPTADESY